jgi:hypothetical protein
VAMIKLFLGNQLLVLLFLPLVVVGFAILNYFTNYFEVLPVIDLGFWGKHSFYAVNTLYFFTGFLVFINAILANYLFNKNEFHDKNTYIISLFYIVLMSFFHSAYQLDGILIAHFFLIIALFQMFRLENNVDGRKWCFNTGLFIGIAGTFHPPLLSILPFLWMMISRIRPFVFREFLLSTLGFLLPLIYVFVYISFNKNLIWSDYINVKIGSLQSNMVFWIMVAFFAVIAFVSLITISYKSNKSSLRFKKLIAILRILMIISILLGIVEFSVWKHFEWFSFFVIPLSFFMPFLFFSKSSTLVGNLLFYGIFSISIAKIFIK